MGDRWSASPLRPRLPRPTGRDVVAGLSVALVLLPQAVAYAVLAGMPPVTGLVVGAVTTLAAAPFVSSAYLQTGPVAITGLLVFGALTPLADAATPEYVGLAAVLALLVGAIRLVIGATRTGAVAYLMSQPVMAGFVPAAAIVIAVSQAPALLGVEADGRGPATIVPALLDPGGWDLHALAIGLLVVVVMTLGRRVGSLFPHVLVAVVAGFGAALLTGFDGDVLGRMPAMLPRLVLDLPYARAAELLVPALVIALVGFAEVAAIARTFARRTRTRWDADREFVSQGVANAAAGLVGGFPVGGSFSRSAVAHTAGARTGWTGAVTGLAMLAATPVVVLVEQLPSAVLAGVIVAAVARLMRPTELVELRRLSRQQFAVAVVTFVLTLVTAPQIQYAVLVGVLLSIGAHLRRELAIAAPSWVADDVLHVRPVGVLFFGSAHRIGDQVGDCLADNPEVDHVTVHMDRLGRVDVTGAQSLRQVLDDLHEQGTSTSVVDLSPTGAKIVQRVLSDPVYGVDAESRAVEVPMPGQL